MSYYVRVCDVMSGKELLYEVRISYVRLGVLRQIVTGNENLDQVRTG